MIKNVISASVLASMLIMGSAYAATATDNDNDNDNDKSSKFAVGGKFGTLGFGMDVTYGFNSKLNARFNLNGGNVDITDEEKDDIKFSGALEGQTIGGILDYHPMAGNFRISAGLYSNGNTLNLDATGTGNSNVQIGERDYDLTGANLNTKVEFKSMAPYIGIGWGNAVKMGSKWRLTADAGVLFQGTPEAKFTGSGSARDIALGQSIDLAENAIFQTELDKEEKNLNNDLKDFEVYPVLSLGVSYRF